MRKVLLISIGLLWAGTAWSEEVIIQREAPVIQREAPVVVERPAGTSKTTVERHGPDCDSKTVHKENDLGESKTVTREDCD